MHNAKSISGFRWEKDCRNSTSRLLVNGDFSKEKKFIAARTPILPKIPTVELSLRNFR